MTTENLTLMTGLLKKIDWLEERQKVLAQNIANADTPNYQAQDVAPLDFKELVDISERKTSAWHNINCSPRPCGNRQQPYGSQRLVAKRRAR